MQKYGKYIGIIVGILILVVLSSGCLNSNTGNFTEPNSNGTYSAYGVSFNYPDNWSADADTENGNISIVASPDHTSNSSTSTQVGPFGFESSSITTSSEDPQFEVDISPNNGMSEQDAINQAKNSIPDDWKKISSSTVTVDGNKAYKDIFTFSDSMGSVRYEEICFVKNGKTYVMTFSAATRDFDKEKQNFDIILNSFKVQ